MDCVFGSYYNKLVRVLLFSIITIQKKIIDKCIFITG